MATMYRGTRASAANIITGAGSLRGLLISHNQATVQTVTLYDNTAASGTILAQIYLNPAQSPYRLALARDDAITFATGLSWSGTNCELNVWAVKH